VNESDTTVWPLIPDQLVEPAVLLNDFSQSLIVSTSNIRCFSTQMLRMSHPANRLIMHWTPKAAVHGDRHPQALAGRLQHLLNQRGQMILHAVRQFNRRLLQRALFAS
jgi:hypothetical protein